MSAPTAHRRLALLSRHLSAAKVRSGVAVMSTTSSAPSSPSSAASAAADDPRKPVCLVVGGGAGIGQSVAKKFASEGYHACVVRRGSGPHRLMEGDGDMPAFIASLEEAGGSGECFFADGTKEDEVSHLVKTIEEDVGPIHVAVYNIGAQVGNRPLAKTSYGIFRRALDMGVVGAFAMAKEVSRHMIERGHGTLLYTGATAAYRGNQQQHAHTAAMGARRNLCQSLNHELGPQGIHVCHVNVDGMVASPETLGKLMPELYDAMMKTKAPNDEILIPDHIAKEYWHLHNQHRSCWTFDLDMRPWKETPWFNS